MAIEVIHPGVPGVQSDTLEFGAVAAAIDNLERISGERIGGPIGDESRELARLERRLYRLVPTTGADWEWLAAAAGAGRGERLARTCGKVAVETGGVRTFVDFF
jgi:hypothetical protein